MQLYTILGSQLPKTSQQRYLIHNIITFFTFNMLYKFEISSDQTVRECVAMCGIAFSFPYTDLYLNNFHFFEDN